jgi:hypothetical protein
MRTTIRLEEELLKQVRQLAAQTGQTMTSIIENALREMLSRRNTPPKRRRVRLITDGKGGLRPGVNLDNMSELYDLMDGINDPD